VPRGRSEAALRWAMAPASAMVAAALVWARMEMPARGAELAERVHARMPETGVNNAVTAVLLDFRSYDTLLEVAVLVLALVAVRALAGGGVEAGSAAAGGERAHGEAPSAARSPLVPPSPSPVLEGLAATVAPVAVVAAGYLWWAGSHAPGGAFQGAAVLAAAGILLVLAGKLDARALESRIVRALAAAGLLTFLGVGGGAVLLGGAFLDLPAAIAGWTIVLLEAVLTVSIAAILLSLFAALR
jgi:multisubunit Na+/H+ antiporter MnhB subunit